MPRLPALPPPMIVKQLQENKEVCSSIGFEDGAPLRQVVEKLARALGRAINEIEVEFAELSANGACQNKQSK